MPHSLGGPQEGPAAAAAAPVTLGHRRHQSAGLVNLPQDGYANENRNTNEFSSVGCLDSNCSNPHGSQFCGDLTSMKVGASVRSLTSKRQAAQKLEPLRGCNVIPLEIPLVTGEAFTTRNSRNVDLCFKDISYSVPTGILRRGIRHILSEVSGEMRAGELTAILGPSGAGKSTLMDILAGYLTSWTGRISTNGYERDLRLFRRQACYIMQDDQLQPLLTVQEAMNTSANLKLGSNYSHKEKQKRIKQILEALGLFNSRKTRTGSLSGGQKKRLAIALELVSNPPVMFFDEPTSGLDSSTSKHCIALLRKLASEGRTVICTIHQPSALLLEMFDHMYALADGKCVYQGSVANLVPYLRDLGFLCPPYHNPADFFLEISTGALEVENVRENCKKNIDTLSQKCENGQNNDWRKKRVETSQINSMMRIDNLMSNGLMTPIRSPIFPMSPCVSIGTQNHRSSSLPKKPSRHSLSINPGAICQDGDTYPTSFLTQVIVLMSRNIRIMTRDRVLTYMRFLIHLSIAITTGILYFQIGKDAHFMQNNFNFLFFAIMFLMFTAFNSMMLTFPLELPIITREHFNRWYSLKAYYMALTLADAPIQFLCTLMFAIITYLMTGQPLEFFRLWYYSFMLIMVSFVGQSIGVFNGAIFDVQTGVIFGPLFMLPFTIFSGFFVHLHDAHYSLRWLFHISYLKYGLEGTMLSIFGYDREKMACDSEYCHYRYPKKFLDSIDMEDANYSYSVIFLGALYLVIRFMIYFVLSYRLKHRKA